MRFSTRLAFLIVLAFSCTIGKAQVNLGNFDVNYNNPREFKIGGITVSGARNFDSQAIILFSGLGIGQDITIPGDQISQAIKSLWKQKLFDNIRVSISEIRGDQVFLDIELTERPRLSRFKFEGLTKGEAETVREKINLIRGTIVNENLLSNTSNIINAHFEEKGFLDSEVKITEYPDTLVANSVYLLIDVEKNKKIKIGNIDFTGVSAMKESKVRKAMKDTKEKSILRIFKRSKFIRSSYQTDLVTIIDKYNAKGYRNAKVMNDSVYRNPNGSVGIDIELYEGNQFYFGNIEWVGNTKYSSTRLSEVLGIEKERSTINPNFKNGLRAAPTVEM